MFVSRFTKTAGAMLAAAVVATALMGCSDDDDGGGDGGGDITNGPNDAWVMCDEDFYDYGEEGCYGTAFRNGKVFSSMEIEGLGWLQFEVGTYTTSGNSITMNMNPELMYDDEPISQTGTYRVSGNELTIDFYGERATFTKQTGITFITVSDPNNMEELMIIGVCVGVAELGLYSSIGECVDDGANRIFNFICMGYDSREECLEDILGDGDFFKRSEINVKRIDVPRFKFPAPSHR